MQKKARKNKQQPAAQKSVFKEAWDNMNADFNRVLPEKLQHKNKKKFVIWVFLLELVILGLIGKALYHWLVN